MTNIVIDEHRPCRTIVNLFVYFFFTTITSNKTILSVRDHCVTRWHDSVACTLAENGKLANQITTLLPIVVKLFTNTGIKTVFKRCHSLARPTATPTSKKPKPVSCVAPACSPQTCLPSCPKPCCTKKRFHDMELVAGCPRVCFSSCEQVCPRRCCGPHPPIKATINHRPKINDIPQSPRCPKICADVCALECPHRCCGPGSMKRAFISRPFPRLAYMKNQYAFNQKRHQVPVSRFNNPRRFGLKKKRNTIH